MLKSVDRGLKRARDAFNKKLRADKSRSRSLDTSTESYAVR